MKQLIFQVDAFTNRPFAGNPAGVCLLEEAKDEHWMQAIAAEMNLAETAFLLPEADGYRLRWFTPTMEVDLCGHATLASAHILWEQGHLQHDQTAIFYTRSGVLTADWKEDWIELDFPADPPEETSLPPQIQQALGVDVKYVGLAQGYYLVEVESEEVLLNLQPDLAKLKQLPIHRDLIVTSRTNRDGIDFLSRMFAPMSGINEDPVTGSAHCCLGPYWGSILHKNQFTAYQASIRGGTLQVSNCGDRVKLGGQAVTVLRCELLV